MEEYSGYYTPDLKVKDDHAKVVANLASVWPAEEQLQQIYCNTEHKETLGHNANSVPPPYDAIRERWTRRWRRAIRDHSIKGFCWRDCLLVFI